MTFPKQTITVRDPGLGLSSPVGGTPVMSGIAHGGSASVNVVTSISDPSTVRSVIGYGPLAEDVALALQQFGGPVLFVIHNSVTSAALSAQVLTAPAGSPPAITVSGTPNDRYALRVEVVTGGILATATFKYCLDGHDATAAPFTQSAVRPTAATYLMVNSGLTLAFPAGTYVAGDVYTLACVPQEPGTVDLALVAAALIAAPSRDFQLWHVSGSQSSKTTGSAMAAALSGHLTTLTSSFRYVRGILDVGSDDTAANIDTEAATWTSARICAAYGYTIRASALPFEGFSNRKTSCVSGIGVRAMRELISSDLSRTASGPDAGVSKIYFDGFTSNTLDTDGISTMRTWPGIPGFYIAGGKLKCPFGSDFTDLQFGRCMDTACRTTYQAQFPYQSESFRTTVAGGIDPRDAASIEQTVENSLADSLLRPNNARGVPGHVSAVNYTVDLAQNIVTTGQLKTSVGIRPLGYAKDIATTLFFTLNP